jgi:EAL domain-containing protein (putative c-di-GMP-specific phosphodiesterase class I)
MRCACADAQYWHQQGFTAVKVAVNVSGRQFRSGELAQKVSSVLRDTGLPAEALEIEITESVLMENLEMSIMQLNQLQADGVYISIDDFGTGYSSLSRLRNLPIDCLKIDRSFIRQIDTDADARSIATSVLSLARALDLEVIAEGVETMGHREILDALGCQKMQGYLFARPMRLREFLNTLSM